MHEWAVPGRLVHMSRKVSGVTKWKAGWLYALCLLLALAPFGAQGQARDAAVGRPATALTIKARVNSLPDMDPQSVEALNGLLAKAVFTLHTRQDGQALGLQWTQDGQPLLTLQSEQAGQQASLLMMIRGGLEATRVTSRADVPPWSLLFGVPAGLASWEEAPALFAQLAADARAFLQPHEKEQQRTQGLKAAGRSTSQWVSQLEAQQADALLLALKPRLTKLLSTLPQQEQLLLGLDALRFSGRQTIRRLVDAAGQDLGLQWTGSLLLADKAYSLSLLVGWSEAGATLSLKAPAKRGNDTLEAAFNLSFAAGVTGDFSARVRTAALDWRLTGKANLVQKQAPEGRSFAGSIDARVRTRGKEVQTVDYALAPDLLILEDGFSGVLSLSQTVSGRTPAQVVLVLDRRQAAFPAPATALATLDLQTVGKEETALFQARVKRALVPAFLEMLLSLPKDSRLMLLHDLGRDLRAQLPDDPALAPLDSVAPSFLVEGVPTDPAQKEDKP